MRKVLIFLLAIGSISFGDSAQAAAVGNSCISDAVRGYYLKNGYCMADMLSCAGGKLVKYDGIDTPAKSEMCGLTAEPSCPRPMAMRLHVSPANTSQEVMALLEVISQSFFDLKIAFQMDAKGNVVIPWSIKVEGTPKFESPDLWNTSAAAGQSRDLLKQRLESEFPGNMQAEVCPGVPEAPSIIGSN